ncbi:GtrA family protein [Corynebacterium sp.]|uniref:GtrA family protein n=1 Tax=Corynebacterium sp. TaxID=1720 RepID=UPI0026DCF0A6|nr:GtrA family protein [Corynebacterium sp.]MDO5032572.1 GtrA family protein [Corynebacterium sp.]
MTQSLRVQGAKFALTGAISAVIDASVTWVLQIGLGVLGDVSSRTGGFICGTLTAYLLNRRWTFKAKASLRRLGAVILTYTLTYVINIAIYRRAFPFFDHSLDWPSSWALVAAFALAQGTATVINFFVQRWFIFRQTRKSFEVP